MAGVAAEPDVADAAEAPLAARRTMAGPHVAALLRKGGQHVVFEGNCLRHRLGAHLNWDLRRLSPNRDRNLRIAILVRIGDGGIDRNDPYGDCSGDEQIES